MCSVVAKELSNLEEQFPAEPMLFVVSALNSLLSDEIDRLYRPCLDRLCLLRKTLQLKKTELRLFTSKNITNDLKQLLL